MKFGVENNYSKYMYASQSAKCTKAPLQLQEILPIFEPGIYSYVRYSTHIQFKCGPMLTFFGMSKGQEFKFLAVFYLLYSASGHF